MNKYTIYFDVFGKKMKKIIYEKSEKDAEIKLRNLIDINIHKVVENKDDDFNFIKDIFNTNPFNNG